MELLIRDVEPDDAEGLVRVLNPIVAARTYTTIDAQVSVEAERAFVLRLPPRSIWKVAVRPSDNRLVGCQILEPVATYTHAFDHVGTLGTFVDLDLRRRGIGRHLFAATFEAARQQGYEKLFTFVRADNPAALGAYLAQGFLVIGTAHRHARIDGRYIDEILIEKPLGPD